MTVCTFKSNIRRNVENAEASVHIKCGLLRYSFSLKITYKIHMFVYIFLSYRGNNICIPLTDRSKVA